MHDQMRDLGHDLFLPAFTDGRLLAFSIHRLDEIKWLPGLMAGPAI